MSNTLATQPSPPWSRIVLGVILCVYLALGALYAAQTPAWQVPDEPAHFNYVRFIAEHGRLPELAPGDYPHAYLEQIKARRFPADMSIDSIRYEAHQPPLYYALAAIAYRIASDLLGLPMPLALRLFSLLLGCIAIWLGYRALRYAFPAQPWLALGSAAFAATLPMHLAMTAAVNNDVLAMLWLNAIAWQLLRMGTLGWSNRRAIGLGILLGLALLTKMQSYVAVGLALFALAWDWLAARRGGAAGGPFSARRALALAAIFCGIALLMASPWLARNMRVYGIADPLGMVRHDQVVIGQLTTAEYIAQHGLRAWLQDWVATTLRSFWGQFGWMGVLLDQRIYQALALCSGLAALGAALALGRLLLSARSRGASTPPQHPWRSVALLLVWAALTGLAYLWYNTKYVQFQGRYLFPALTVWGTCFAVGAREIMTRSWRYGATALAVGVAAVIAVSILGGDLKGFALALLVVAALGLSVGRLVERVRPGLGLVFVYVGMGALAIIALQYYIVPALK
jgi:hypothetical protein